MTNLRQQLLDILYRGNPKLLSRFTINWIQSFDKAFPSDGLDDAIEQGLGVILEVLKDGPDRDFFQMLYTYIQLTR